MKRKADESKDSDGGKAKKARVEQTILMFNSKSKNVAAGQGAKESLRDGDSFAVLNKIPNWRKVVFFHDLVSHRCFPPFT